ncbi:hypothetical protein [Methanolobus bombayensis]|uniref:hypothetical protein n=1 Tax=Methanolobus bombayensis TaxID=38023 RepID=UPI001AE60667|nr:hypothetical protein [Methanolobus bombayensis]MBP1908255.1 hypothetical protein [Methanolobus bombayensis]
MLENNQITNLSQEDIDNLSYTDNDKFFTFKTNIEEYYDSVAKIQYASNQASQALNQKNSYIKASKKSLPFKVYFETIGLYVLFGIFSSYYIFTSDSIQITQSYTKMYIFLLYILLIILAVFLPFLMLPKKT